MSEAEGGRAGQDRKSPAARFMLWTTGLALALAAAAYVAFQVSPWPSALFYRYLMNREAVALSEALRKYVPGDVISRTNERYDPADPDALLDVFYPSAVENTARPLMTIVWFHGGGWISGSKDQVANYLRILAGKGYTVVGVNYTLAPAARYPKPLRQINAALGFLVKNAERLHIDPARIVLAGDSAGAQLAAQLANIIAVPAYADLVGIAPTVERRQLAGMILYCGMYDAKLLRFDGPFAGFVRSVGWSYFGRKNFQADTKAAEFSVLNYVTRAFPPIFISAGNADPLLPQSLVMATAVAAKGVRVERLFFPPHYEPPLGHEYQFNLDTEAGKLALERSLKFLAGL